MNRFPQDRGPLYTLEQVGERTDIHPMLLQSYLRSAAWRVPTVWVAGEERYPREALAAFREIHQEAQLASAPLAADPGAGDAPNWGRRRLLSLTAQRRSGEARDREAAANGAARGSAQRGSAQRGRAEPGSDENGSEERGSRDERGSDERSGNDELDSRETAGNGVARVAAAHVHQRLQDAADGGAEAAELAMEPAAPAEPGASVAPSRTEPRRPLYTLQQVHEYTGIPYPLLALYAASEAGSIPSAGERYAPLYPWEALRVFCGLHQERNPSWQAPSLPATPPLPEEEAAARELSARLERLERAQTQLADQIRVLLEEDESYLTATVWG
jgi:hypothetical protein